jgi:prolyl-tRNA synthetase
VIVPIYKTDDERARVMESATKVRGGLSGNGVRVKIDDRDQHRPGFKFAEWELKGVPIRVELGPKDVDADQVVLANRVTGAKEPVSTEAAISGIAGILDDVQKALFDDAVAFRDANTHDVATLDQLKQGVEAEGGFWVTPWCGDAACEAKVSAETSASIRVLPLEREDPGGACLVCGKPGVERATWAKAY